MPGLVRTFERREATVEDKLQIAEVALRQGQGGERLGLLEQGIMTRGIAGEEVLERTAVGRVGHVVGILGVCVLMSLARRELTLTVTLTYIRAGSVSKKAPLKLLVKSRPPLWKYLMGRGAITQLLRREPAR